jgi:KaiC domain protein
VSDDDWFERAFADEEGSGDDGDDGAPADDGGDGGDAKPGDADPADAERGGSAASADASTRDASTDGPEDAAARTDATAEQPTTEGEPSESPASPGDDFEAAFGFEAGAASADDDSDSGDAGADPFGGVRDGPNRSPRGRSDDGHDPFPEDFAAAMKGAPSVAGDAETEAPRPDAGTESFDEEEFESDIDRLDIGIDGLDEMVLGGVPKRSLMVTIGSAGTGKTTFGLQFLNRALENGEKAVYITLEESRERIFDTAEEKGWEFRRYAAEDRLAVIDLDPVEMANSLANIQSDLPRLVADFGAERLVLDSVSLLEMMYDHPSERRSQVFDFARALKDAGVTTLLTSEAKEDNPYTSRHGLVEYLADAVFVLQYVRPSDFRETRLAIEIQKIRDANHSRETKPYELTSDGISVYRQANIF